MGVTSLGLPFMDKIQKPFDFRKPLNIFQKASEMKLPPSLPTEKHKTKRPLLSKKKRTQTHPLLQKHCMLVPSTKGIQSYIKPKDVTVYKKLYSATLIRDKYIFEWKNKSKETRFIFRYLILYYSSSFSFLFFSPLLYILMVVFPDSFGFCRACDGQELVPVGSELCATD